MKVQASSDGNSIGGANGNETENRGDLFDFSHLPEHVWLQIMQDLPLADKYHVSTTCSRLHGLFQNPSLWRSIQVRLSHGRLEFAMTDIPLPQEVTAAFVNTLGPLVRQLVLSRFIFNPRLSLAGDLALMERDTRHLITRLSRVASLEHLVLDVSMMTSDLRRRKFIREMKTLMQLITNGSSLQRIDVVSWPSLPSETFDSNMTPQPDIFDTIAESGHLARGLQSLSLYWIEGDKWPYSFPPSPMVVNCMVSRLHGLRHLALQSPLVGDLLITTLSCPYRVRLASLQIQLMYPTSGVYAGLKKLPEVDPSSWAALHAQSPDMDLVLERFSCVADAEIQEFLHPQVPLTGFRVMQSRCSPDLLRCLSDRFRNSLKSFMNYNENTPARGCEVVSMVKQCRCLQVLVFHGAINSNYILEIAKLPVNWKRLEFLEKSIITDNEPGCCSGEPATGVDASSNRNPGVTRRQMALADLNAEVSRRLGRKWKPVRQ